MSLKTMTYENHGAKFAASMASLLKWINTCFSFPSLALLITMQRELANFPGKSLAIDC